MAGLYLSKVGEEEMKVIFLDHTPFIGGAQLVLASHLKYLNKNEFAPILICSKQTAELASLYRHSGAKVYPIEFGRLKSFNPNVLRNLTQAYQEISEIVRKEKPKLLVSNTVRAHLMAALIAKKQKLPLIWVIRDYTFPRILFRLLRSIPQKILTVSQDLVRFYGLKGYEGAKVIYVGSDFDVELKRFSPTDVAKLKQNLGLSSKDPIIGFVGRLVYWKGAQVLIEAMADIVKTFPKAKALIIGGGSAQERDNEKDLKNLASILNLEKSILFCGFKPQTEVPLYYKTFDCFVHSSLEPEPFATVVVQAMMVPLPVVATNVGGTPEIIKNKTNGLLVNPDNSQELAVSIIKILSDQNLAKRLAQKALASVYPRLTEKEFTKGLERTYKELA